MKFLLAMLISIPCFAKTIKIAVVDSGLNLHSKQDIKLCPYGHSDLTGTGFKDNLGHGTNISYIIADRLKDIDYCIIVIKVFDIKNQEVFGLTPSKVAFLYLLTMGNIDIINFSAGGRGDDHAEKILVSALIASNIKFISAAGNDFVNLDKDCYYYPACYNGVISVGNLMDNGKPAWSSNYGKRVTFWEWGTQVCGGGVCMTGTSQATAIHTAKEARELAKRKK